MISDKEAAQFLKVIEQDKVHIFYVKTTAEYGMINGEWT